MAERASLPDPEVAKPPPAVPATAPDAAPPRRLHAVIRYPLIALLGVLIAVLASYLLRKIGY